METTQCLAAFARKLGKIPIIVKDSPGFLVNRLLLPYLNEACHLLQEGADISQVDKELLEFGMPMGVFILLDQVGIDIVVHAGESMLHAFGERMTPSPIIGAMAQAQRLGKKTGKGFYTYDSGGQRHPDPEVSKLLNPYVNDKKNFTSDQVIPRLIYSMINEATLCLEEGVVETVEAIDAGMILGAGFPPFTGGLLRYADEVGARSIFDTLTELAQAIDGRFKPSATLRKMAEGEEVFYP
jgi:3-hydroxyacyl-CoA dehydrogenase/enoyl-CoA hydratase/3-hydroxybutyryl-CoA epimerase